MRTGSDVPSMTRRRTRQAIIDAAITTWVSDRDATLGEIAGRAGTHRSTLHRHFPSRAELFDAAVVHCVDEITTATDSAAVTEGSPAAALRRLVAAYLAIGERIRFLFDDLAAARHPAVAGISSTEGPVIELIRRGQRHGPLEPSLPAAWIERSIWALVYAASEAIDDGLVPAYEALPILLRTIEAGISQPADTIRHTDARGT